MGDCILKIIVNERVNKDLSHVVKLLHKGLFDTINNLIDNKSLLYTSWKETGEAKIVLSGNSKQIREAYEEAKKRSVLVHKSEVDGVVDMLILGPDHKSTLNEFTNKFKLL